MGWKDWAGNWKEDVFDFVTPYPDYDVDELRRYAASLNYKWWCHPESAQYELHRRGPAQFQQRGLN